MALHGQLLHLTDRAVGCPHASSVGIEIEHDPLAVADAAQLGDLLAAECSSQCRHSIGGEIQACFINLFQEENLHSGSLAQEPEELWPL